MIDQRSRLSASIQLLLERVLEQAIVVIRQLPAFASAERSRQGTKIARGPAERVCEQGCGQNAPAFTNAHLSRHSGSDSSEIELDKAEMRIARCSQRLPAGSTHLLFMNTRGGSGYITILHPYATSTVRAQLVSRSGASSTCRVQTTRRASDSRTDSRQEVVKLSACKPE